MGRLALLLFGLLAVVCQGEPAKFAAEFELSPKQLAESRLIDELDLSNLPRHPSWDRFMKGLKMPEDGLGRAKILIGFLKFIENEKGSLGNVETRKIVPLKKGSRLSEGWTYSRDQDRLEIRFDGGVDQETFEKRVSEFLSWVKVDPKNLSHLIRESKEDGISYHLNFSYERPGQTEAQYTELAHAYNLLLFWRGIGNSRAKMVTKLDSVISYSSYIDWKGLLRNRDPRFFEIRFHSLPFPSEHRELLEIFARLPHEEAMKKVFEEIGGLLTAKHYDIFRKAVERLQHHQGIRVTFASNFPTLLPRTLEGVAKHAGKKCLAGMAFLID